MLAWNISEHFSALLLITCMSQHCRIQFTSKLDPPIFFWKSALVFHPYPIHVDELLIINKSFGSRMGTQLSFVISRVFWVENEQLLVELNWIKAGASYWEGWCMLKGEKNSSKNWQVNNCLLVSYRMLLKSCCCRLWGGKNKEYWLVYSHFIFSTHMSYPSEFFCKEERITSFCWYA